MSIKKTSRSFRLFRIFGFKKRIFGRLFRLFKILFFSIKKTADYSDYSEYSVLKTNIRPIIPIIQNFIFVYKKNSRLFRLFRIFGFKKRFFGRLFRLIKIIKFNRLFTTRASPLVVEKIGLRRPTRLRLAAGPGDRFFLPVNFKKGNR